MSKINHAINSLVASNIPFMNGKFKQNSPISTYLQYYGLDISTINYRYGFLNCCGERIFIQTFEPIKPVATVLIVHGYLDHTGSMSNLINFLTKKRYHVICYDLQGHGLSSGEKSSINSFEDYVNVFKEICENYIEPSPTKRRFLIAHSTGAAISMDNLLRSSSIFDNVILLAPLIRTYFWNLSKIGLKITYPFLHELQRVFKVNSSNKEYLKFVRNDPLQHNKISLKWVHALSLWNERIINDPPSQKSLLVIQGDRDKTVDWKYNLNFIQAKFPQSKTQIIKNANHQLINENSALLAKTLSFIDEYLRK
jgi:alpha-beta hydrolase superfamily lysophospholipase